MATTAVATGSALTKKLWSSYVFSELGQNLFFGKYSGTDDNNIIQLLTDLEKGPGDRITTQLALELSNAGQTSQTATVLEGNEEALSLYTVNVTLSEYAHAVRSDGKLTLKRTAFDMRKLFKSSLVRWWKNRIENLLITELSTSPTSARGINITSGQPSSGEVMSTALIDQAERLAELSDPKVAPLLINGQEWYILLMHPYQMKALRVETAWINAQRDLGPRDKTNPIFSLAGGYWGKCIIVVYDRIVLSSPTEARALLLGKQACLQAWGQRPGWYEKDFDYNRYPGVGTDALLGIAKTVFNSQDFGVITLDTRYVAD
ncbi:MAG: N4-gp56 family major capsid protein [Planctomycetota bacterium]|nr:N4-gp56 family major capsid protein [Planctomycetota bacterium]